MGSDLSLPLENYPAGNSLEDCRSLRYRWADSACGDTHGGIIVIPCTPQADIDQVVRVTATSGGPLLGDEPAGKLPSGKRLPRAAPCLPGGLDVRRKRAVAGHPSSCWVILQLFHFVAAAALA